MQPNPEELVSPLLFLLTLGLMLFGLGLGVLAIQLIQGRHPQSGPPLPPAVGRRELFVGLGLFLLASIIVAGLTEAIGVELDASRQLALSAALMAVAIYPALRSSIAADRLDALGWVSPGSGRGLRTGIMVWFLLMPLFFGFNLFWSQAWVFFTGELPVQDVKDLISTSGEGSGIIFLLVVFLMPFLEELLFRGVLLNSLRSRFGAAFAIGASSLVFAALHGPAASGPIFVLALAMGGAMVLSGNLFVPFALHAMNNGVQIVLLSFSTSL